MRRLVQHLLVGVCLCLLFTVSGPSAEKIGSAGGPIASSDAAKARASHGRGGGDVAGGYGVAPVIGLAPDDSIAGDIRAAMELEAQALAALQAARIPQAAALAALVAARDDGARGDPSHVHALDRVDQAIQAARLAESSLERSLDDLTAALALLPAAPQLSQIVLTPAVLNLLTCSDAFVLTATASDFAGLPLQGVTIVFEFAGTGTLTATGTFNPPVGVSDAGGRVETTLTIDPATCLTNCSSGKECSTMIRARTQDGLVSSNLVPINDQIP